MVNLRNSRNEDFNPGYGSPGSLRFGQQLKCRNRRGSIWRERPIIRKIPQASVLDSFVDKIGNYESIELSKPFEVATLNKREDTMLSGSHPRGLGGPVTVLSSTPVGGVFGGCKQHKKNLNYADDVETDLAQIGSLPEGHDYVIEDETFHPYKGVTRPRTTTRERPPSMYKDESEGDLLTPAERLINKEHLKRTRMAQNEFRKAEAAKSRRLDIIQKMYPKGIVGIDSPENRDSPMYANIARVLRHRRAKTAAATLARSNFLHSRTCGFNFTENARQDPALLEAERSKWIKRKARAQTSHGTKSSHETLFGDRSFKSPIGGYRWKIENRDFDILSGCPKR